MNPYPEERSVLVLDNCIVHHQYEVLEAVAARGCRILFLEPYDPERMPVEDCIPIDEAMAQAPPRLHELHAACRAD